MKKLISFLVTITGLLITFNQSLPAQEAIVNKLFYTELGGPGIIMSMNFDSRFNSNERVGFGYRLGAGFGISSFYEGHSVEGYSYVESVTRTIYSFPVGLNYVFGKPNKSSSFEVGGGVSILSRKASLYNFDVEKFGYVIGHISFMYRITPINGGFSFRAGFTPIVGTAGDLYPMGAIGFGYAF